MRAWAQVVPGELSIVTGVPNSGKSEWIDALLCNLATQHGWSFAMCSMEKKVKDTTCLNICSVSQINALTREADQGMWGHAM